MKHRRVRHGAIRRQQGNDDPKPALRLGNSSSSSTIIIIIIIIIIDCYNKREKRHCSSV
jgi:hypothetical protein